MGPASSASPASLGPSPPGAGLRVAMVAAERSGDQLAALLLQGMRQRWSGLQASGIGGPLMQAQGFVAHHSCDELTVRGLVEGLWAYRRISAIRRRYAADLLRERPDLYLGVDASDFNLPLERQLNRAGIPAIQLVCPSIWAWRPGRVHAIRRSVRHVLCLFPFEPELLARHGIAGTFVGHPVADLIALEPDQAGARQRLGLDPEATVVALLPGSRVAEIAALAMPFLHAARLMAQQRPQLRFVLPTHEGLRPTLEQALRTTGMVARVQLVLGQAHTVQAACDVALVASGTATLECALHKRPMVIAYRMQWLSWWVANQQRRTPWIGLPNILCQQSLVPELLQQQAQPEALARATLAWLDDPAAVARLRQRFTDMHLQLRQDMPARASHAIAQILQA